MNGSSDKHSPIWERKDKTPEEPGQDVVESPPPSGETGNGEEKPWKLPTDPGTDTSELFSRLKDKVHRRLIEEVNLPALQEADNQQRQDTVRRIVSELLDEEEEPLSQEERQQLTEQVLDEIFGYGPLEPLLEDPSVSDILVNTYNQVYVEREGKLERTEVRFRDNEHLRQIIERMVTAVGRRIDESSPMVDARLPDGSRINAVIPPLAIDGPHLSIRKFRTDALAAQDLLRYRTLTEKMLRFLRAAVKARLNILIAGGTGSGKTTFLNMLSEAIPRDERIVTIEDSAELQLRQPHVVRLETRPPSVEGTGEVTQRHLVINSLRMRPDRIIVGEVRGPEAVDMLQAMNTGHDGSLTTLHANSPRDALSRLETMFSMAELDLPEKGMRDQISSAIDLVIHLTRLPDGSRKVMKVAEIAGTEGEVISMQDIFWYEREGISPDGEVKGHFRAAGFRPECAKRLEAYGIKISDTLFHDPDAQHEEEETVW